MHHGLWGETPLVCIEHRLCLGNLTYDKNRDVLVLQPQPPPPPPCDTVGWSWASQSPDRGPATLRQVSGWNTAARHCTLALCVPQRALEQLTPGTAVTTQIELFLLRNSEILIVYWLLLWYVLFIVIVNERISYIHVCMYVCVYKWMYVWMNEMELHWF